MSSDKYRKQDVRAARGTTLTAKSWLTEAPLRMLMNNLDPEVAENPHELVVYGGIGRAARNWATKRCWCNPANRWAYSKPIKMRPAC